MLFPKQRPTIVISIAITCIEFYKESLSLYAKAYCDFTSNANRRTKRAPILAQTPLTDLTTGTWSSRLNVGNPQCTDTSKRTAYTTTIANFVIALDSNTTEQFKTAHLTFGVIFSTENCPQRWFRYYFVVQKKYEPFKYTNVTAKLPAKWTQTSTHTTTKSSRTRSLTREILLFFVLKKNSWKNTTPCKYVTIVSDYNFMETNGTKQINHYARIRATELGKKTKTTKKVCTKS